MQLAKVGERPDRGPVAKHGARGDEGGVGGHHRDRGERGENAEQQAVGEKCEAAGHPFKPVVATPSTRNRWKAKKNSPIGSSVSTDIAIIAP